MKIGLLSLLLLAAFSKPLYGSSTKAFQQTKLSNGLDIITVESHKVPLVTIVLAVRAGGFTETPETNGLTHLWEHMFFKGNKSLPDQEAFNRRVRELGIIFNGDTSPEKVRYYFTLPSVNLNAGLDFMYQAISGPLLDPIELKKERRVVLDEYDRNASQPGFDMHRLLKRIIYGNMYYLRDALGERNLIANATRKQLFVMKDAVFVPKNSALLIAGDFNPKELQKTVRKIFNSWSNPKGWTPPKPKPFPRFPKSNSVIMTSNKTRNVAIRWTYNGPKARISPKDTYAADVLISLLNLKTGKFHKKYIESGQALAAGLSYYTQSQAGEVKLYGYTNADKAAQLRKDLAAAPKEWLQADYFSPSELDDVKRSLKIGRLYNLNKPSEYIKNLAFWWAVTGLNYYGDYLDNLLTTDISDVRNFIKKYLIDKNRIETIFLSPSDAKTMGVKDNSAPLIKKHLANPS